MDWRRIGRTLLDLFYPRRAECMGCGSWLGCERDDLCDECRQALAKGWIGLRQPPRGSGIDGMAFACRYVGPAGGMVRNLKYRGVWLLAEEMGEGVARAAMLLRIENICYMAAVPMHPKRLRARDKNHAELLACSAAEKLNLEYFDLLERTRNASQQARLSREERKKNLRGGFAVKRKYRELVKGAEVLVIDDVFTTGATAVACAAALREAGAERVYFAAYAYGEGKKHG